MSSITDDMRRIAVNLQELADAVDDVYDRIERQNRIHGRVMEIVSNLTATQVDELKEAEQIIVREFLKSGQHRDLDSLPIG